MRKVSSGLGALVAAGLAAPAALATPAAMLDQGVYTPGTFQLDNVRYTGRADPNGGPHANAHKVCKIVKLGEPGGKRKTGGYFMEQYCIVGGVWTDMGAISAHQN